MINGHGDNCRDKSPLTANFSTNIPAQCRNAKLLAHVANKVSTVAHYPDPDAKTLAEKLAKKYALKRTDLLVTNGATEAFYLIAELYRGKHSLIFVPSFAEYEDACLHYKHRITFTENRNLQQIKPVDYDLVWLCNPNNPDGKILDVKLLRRWLVSAPDTVFVLDEAYIELVDVESMLGAITLYKNLIVVRSMTKRYCIPGLRLGFMAAQSTILNQIEPLLMPWRINQLALEAGYFIADGFHRDDFCQLELIQESIWLQKEINKIDGFHVVPSPVNFFLIKGNMLAKDLKKWLLSTHDILIRDASNFRGLDKSYFRIAAADRHDNDLLLKALLEWSRMQ